MSTLSQHESYPPDADLAGEVDVTQRPQLTLIEGELGTHDLPIVDDVVEPLRDYSYDGRRAEAARTNPNAFESLHEEYTGLIRLKASNYFLPGGDAQDLIQEGMIGFYKGVRDYDGQQSSLRSFLDLCITRQIITAVKTATRNKHRPLSEATSLSLSPFEVGDDAAGHTLEDVLPAKSRPLDEMLVGREAFKDLSSMLTSELSQFERNVLAEYMDGDTYEAIAQRLNCNAKAVDNAVQRVKGKVGRYLKIRDTSYEEEGQLEPEHQADEPGNSEQEEAWLNHLYADWMANVYGQPGNNLLRAVSDLRNRAEAQDVVMRETRGYVALIALDSGWPSPLKAYGEACRLVKQRAVELSENELSSEILVTDALIDAAIKAIKVS